VGAKISDYYRFPVFVFKKTGKWVSIIISTQKVALQHCTRKLCFAVCNDFVYLVFFEILRTLAAQTIEKIIL